MTENFEIVLGTYEQFLLGYKIEKTNDERYSIKQTFATKSHTGSIRAVASCEKFLASAGTDDRIFIYDMNTRKEVQMLIHHTGTVNTIAFTPKASHIISGSSDGTLAIVRTGNWQLEKLFGSAHKKLSVNNVAVHPSGKLALSIGGDWVLRTWNLVKGRHAYATNLASRGPHGRFFDTIHWSNDGSLFTLTGSKKLEIWSIGQAEVIDTQELEAKIVSCCWTTDTKLVCGLEDGNFIVYETNTKMKFLHKAHNCRIRCVASKNDYIVTCDSSGLIKLWTDYDNDEVTEICSTNASCRITCITVLDNNHLKREKNESEELNVTVKEQDNISESEIENFTEPKPLKRREVIIIEEEINEVKIPADKESSKKNKNKRKASHSNLIGVDIPEKQKKYDNNLTKQHQKEESSSISKQNSKLLNKNKNKLNQSMELLEESTETCTSFKKNKNKKLNALKDFSTASEETIVKVETGNPNEKNKKQKRNKYDSPIVGNGCIENDLKTEDDINIKKLKKKKLKLQDLQSEAGVIKNFENENGCKKVKNKKMKMQDISNEFSVYQPERKNRKEKKNESIYNNEENTSNLENISDKKNKRKTKTQDSKGEMNNIFVEAFTGKKTKKSTEQSEGNFSYSEINEINKTDNAEKKLKKKKDVQCDISSSDNFKIKKTNKISKNVDSGIECVDN